MGRRLRRTVAGVLLAAAVGVGCAEGRNGPEATPATRPAAQALPASLPDSLWTRLVAELSEPGGYFDTDNLISNETGYLHVMGAIDRLGVSGGAYVGVGPDQNFSYMARIRPELAFLIDIRRDNLLQHLLFRALFDEAESRAEYLALLHGRAPPGSPTELVDAGPAELVRWVADQPGGPESSEAERARERVAAALSRIPFEWRAGDLETIARFHGEFIRYGPALRFRSFGRAPRPHYPTYAQLVTGTDLDGTPASYLATEEDWRWLESFHAGNRVIPVVGDLAGEHALRAIGDEVRRRGLVVSALYASNVEFYLWQDGTFDRFEANVATLPVDDRGVLIRSHFPNIGGRHPHAVPGSYSTQTLQTLASFQSRVAEGGYLSYWNAVTRDAIDPRTPGGDGP